MKRVFIVHGWGGYPLEGWFPWLKAELEMKGFSVAVPQMPDTDNPRIESWVPALAIAVGVADADTYFVGHSMGCQTIARYLEALPEGVRVDGAVFVAGFFKQLTNIEEDGPDAVTIAAAWLDTPLDFMKIKSHVPKSVAVFSDNDPYVPLDNQDDFRNKLGSEIIIEKNAGHFSGSDGIVELPKALNAVLSLSERQH